MNEIKTTKLLAVIAVIFVTAALVTLPYQSQVANAAPMKKYQIVVTLTSVPANAEDLNIYANITNASSELDSQEKIVSSPSEGDVVKFVLTAPSGSATGFSVCGTIVPPPFFGPTSTCDFGSLPS